MCREAVEKRLEFHPSGRVIYFDENVFHLEASKYIRKIERLQRIKKYILLMAVK